jgi:hypothetical protein
MDLLQKTNKKVDNRAETLMGLWSASTLHFNDHTAILDSSLISSRSL